MVHRRGILSRPRSKGTWACVTAALVVIIVCLSPSAAALDMSSIIADDGDINEVRYAIEYVSAADKDSSFVRPEPAAQGSNRWVVMTASNGTKYDCLLPEPRSGPSAASLRDAKRKLIGTEVSAEVRANVQAAFAEACVMRGSGWWVYEVCWGRHVRQYHSNAQNQVETEYHLGLGPHHKLEKGATGVLVYGESPVHGLYVATQYYNGTPCDLTGKPRWVEIRASCLTEGDDAGVGGAAVAALFETTEVETCVYTASIKHAALCDIPQLKKEVTETKKITCQPRGP